jgi:hypothetical protein
LGEGFGHVAAAITEADMTGLVVDGAGEKQHAGVTHKMFTKGVDVNLRFEASETNGAGVGRCPFEDAGMTSEKSGEEREVAENDLEIAVDEFLTMAEGEGGEEFTGSAGANGGVVLQGNNFLKKLRIRAGEPAKAESRKAVGFADRGETDGTVVEVAGGGEASGGIVFEFTVDFVGENVNTLVGGEIQDAAKDRKCHEQTSGIVRSIDIDGASVGADKAFKCGEVVSPSIIRIAAPLANGSAGAFGEGEGTFVARRFDDGMVLWSEQRMVEKKNSFLGGRNDNELMRMNFGVDGGQDFAEPGRAGRFGVAAPMIEESVMSAGFEREKVGNGLGFGVGGGEQVLRGEFVLAHVFFNAKWRDLHKQECAKGRGKASRTKLSGRGAGRGEGCNLAGARRMILAPKSPV